MLHLLHQRVAPDVREKRKRPNPGHHLLAESTSGVRVEDDSIVDASGRGEYQVRMKKRRGPTPLAVEEPRVDGPAAGAAANVRLDDRLAFEVKFCGGGPRANRRRSCGAGESIEGGDDAGTPPGVRGGARVFIRVGDVQRAERNARTVRRTARRSYWETAEESAEGSGSRGGKVRRVVEEGGHLAVRVQEGVLTLAEDVDVRGDAGVILGETQADLLGGEVVAGVGGPPDAGDDVPGACLGIGVRNNPRAARRSLGERDVSHGAGGEEGLHTVGETLGRGTRPLSPRARARRRRFPRARRPPTAPCEVWGNAFPGRLDLGAGRRRSVAEGDASDASTRTAR